MEDIIERLKYSQNRESTNKNYMHIWWIFNHFLGKLDSIPPGWERWTQLFVAHMIDIGLKSATVKSYVSAIKKVLTKDDYDWDDNLILLNTLTRACHIVNDMVGTHFPIHCSLLEILLFEIQRLYHNQPYLLVMYQALLELSYYGLMWVGELAVNLSGHTVKAADVHMATNKDKLLLMLYTSKPHSVAAKPQKIKIVSIRR